jgi:hypothetical protein
LTQPTAYVPQFGSAIFCTKAGSGITMADFRFETVDSAANPMGFCCLVLDKAGNPRIAFAGPQGEIKLAQRNAGTWTVEDVTAGGFISASENNRVWLQLDSAGNPQVAYVARTSDHLLYGAKRDGHWTFQEIPTSSLGLGAPIHISFLLHPGRFTPELRDTPHFLFHDGSHEALGYTRLINGVFKTLSIDPEATESGMFSSAAVVEGSDEINIAYVANLADPVKQMLHTMRIIDPSARRLSVDEGTLSVSQPLGAGVFIRPTSLAGEPGRQCVACHDSAERTLKANIQDSGVISFETVARDVAGTVPSAAKHLGLYRIAFADGNTVKFASRDRQANWSIEIIDATGGAMPSLAYDNAKNCHIGYVAGTTLKYATRKEAA